MRGRRVLVVGASRGIGAALAAHLVARGAEVLSVSRSPAVSGMWVEADIACDAGLDAITTALGDDPLDAAFLISGIWEAMAFTPDYDFLACPRDQIRAVIDVNLTAPILLAQLLAPRLARAADPRLVLMGSTSGLDNFTPREVAYGASKAGLRVAAQALETALRPHGIAVTLINPENVLTEEVAADRDAGLFADETPIPVADILATIDYTLGLSAASVPAEINLVQRDPGQRGG